jgi:hypothetical protein
MGGKRWSVLGHRALIISWYEVCSFWKSGQGARRGNRTKARIAWKEGKGHVLN